MVDATSGHFPTPISFDSWRVYSVSDRAEDSKGKWIQTFTYYRGDQQCVSDGVNTAVCLPVEFFTWTTTQIVHWQS